MINSRPICQGDGVIALQFSGEKTNMEISILNVWIHAQLGTFH